jgi:hypothetical protein
LQTICLGCPWTLILLVSGSLGLQTEATDAGLKTRLFEIS